MQLIWANRSKLNIMKTFLLKFKNNFFKEEGTRAIQHNTTLYISTT